MTRLIVLVLVPLSVLGVQAVHTTASRSQVAAQARQVQDQGTALIAVMRVGFAISSERIPVVAQVEKGNVGLTSDQIAQMLGYNAKTWLNDRQNATDAALAALPADTRLTTVQQLVQRARDDIESSGVTEQTGTRLLDAQTAVQTRAEQIAADLTRETAALAGSSSIARDVLAMQLTYQACLLQSDLAAGLFSVSIAEAGGSPQSQAGIVQSPAQARADLLQKAASFENLGTEIETLGSAAVRTAWSQIQADPATRQLDQAVQQAVGTTADTPAMLAGVTGVAPTVRQSLQRQQVYSDLVETASSVVLDDVRSMRSRADSAYRNALAQAGAVGLLVLLGTFLISRTVTRPLREIADRAHRLRDGDLAFDAAAGSGPREVVAVGQAFNDVAVNLRLLEEQATALANGDTHHESLQRRAPGKLGSSLQASVARLSQSIEAREELESRLRHEATHDRLTGLLNRASAIVALEQGVARAHRVGGGLAVLMVDLDGLKRINDASGHSTGDAVLRRAATRLAKAVRGGDIVARLGADEFMVMAEVNGITDAVELGQRIVTALSGTSADVVGPIVSPHLNRRPGPPLTVAASVGVAITLDGRATPQSLMGDADAAVARAKDGGGARLELFDEELRRQLAERAAIEAALTAAMARGDLELHYQPIVAQDGTMAGMEALCRWTDPVLGEVSPSVFVQVSEASDLIVELDRWVLKEATRQLAEWQRSGQMQGVYLSVNLSGRHLLGTGVVGDVRSALTQSQVDPSALVLEVTETVLLDDLLVAAQNLTELRELGIRVAVDDFGTGYTSIAHLQRLPVDIVKIDRSFIADLTSPRGRSLVRLMIDMAATLGLGLVAEGVETPGELQHLLSMGCPMMQGYLLGRPMVPASIPQWSTTVIS